MNRVHPFTILCGAYRYFICFRKITVNFLHNLMAKLQDFAREKGGLK